MNYTSIARRYRVLPKAEQLDLLRRKQDPKIMQRLILHNMGLVLKNAAFFVNLTQHLEFEDLVSEGLIGLRRAIEKFQPERGHCLSTYAHFWIRQSIRRAIQTKESAIRVPAFVLEQVRRGERPHPARYVLSLDYPIQSKGESLQLLDTIAAEDPPNLDLGFVCPKIEQFPQLWREVLYYHYVLGYAFHEIGSRLNKSRHQIARIHGKAIRELRKTKNCKRGNFQ